VVLTAAVVLEVVVHHNTVNGKYRNAILHYAVMLCYVGHQ